MDRLNTVVGKLQEAASTLDGGPNAGAFLEASRTWRNRFHDWTGTTQEGTPQQLIQEFYSFSDRSVRWRHLLRGPHLMSMSCPEARHVRTISGLFSISMFWQPKEFSAQILRYAKARTSFPLTKVLPEFIDLFWLRKGVV